MILTKNIKMILTRNIVYKYVDKNSNAYNIIKNQCIV